MRTKKILLQLVLMAIASFSAAQVKVEFAGSLTQDELLIKQLDATKQQQVEAALTARLAEYSKRGKLLNPKTNMVDRESANSFKELFSLDAKVVNDIREIPEAYLRSLDEYIDLARSYFLAYGLTFGINSAQIIEVEHDELSGRYTFNVLVSKTVEQYFKDNGTVENGVRTYSLEFLYSMKLNDMDNARITMIRLSKENEKPADLYSRMFNLGLGVGYSLPTFTETSFFKMDGKQGNLSLRPGLDLSIGLSAMSNFLTPKQSPNKRLFIMGGVTGFYQKITGELRDYTTQSSLNVEGQIPEATQGNFVEGDVFRIASNVNVDEEQTLIGLRVPVGFGFRLFNKNLNSAMISVQYAPSMVLSAKGTLTGTGDYAMDIGNYGYNTSDERAYGDPNFADAYEIGIEKQLEASPKISTLITHGILLSGYYFKDLVDDSPTIGVALGVHYYMPFTDLWEFGRDPNVDQPFLYYDSVRRPGYIEPGVLSPFMEKVKLSHVGISINIYTKKVRQP